jgi:hypothetical protein
MMLKIKRFLFTKAHSLFFYSRLTILFVFSVFSFLCPDIMKTLRAQLENKARQTFEYWYLLHYKRS